MSSFTLKFLISFSHLTDLFPPTNFHFSPFGPLEQGFRSKPTMSTYRPNSLCHRDKPSDRSNLPSETPKSVQRRRLITHFSFNSEKGTVPCSEEGICLLGGFQKRDPAL